MRAAISTAGASRRTVPKTGTKKAEVNNAVGVPPVDFGGFVAHVGGLFAAVFSQAAPAAAPAAASAAPSGACDVMISYRVPETGVGGDRSVFALQKALHSRGYTVFVGEAAIQGGSSWPTTIQKGVEDCKAFVVLCSATYGDAAVSPWTKRELELADNLKKPLLPVWHSGPYPPKPVAIYLGGLQRFPRGNIRDGYVKARISHESVAEELMDALQRIGVAPTARQR